VNRIGRAVAGSLMAFLMLAAPAAAQDRGADQGTLVLEEVDADRFPLVRAIVSGPKLDGDLDEGFVVTENGQSIDADVIRLRGDKLNVVVALDVSGSMEGEPLARAKAAVGELLETLPETVPVSIVSFGERAAVQSGFTTDRDASTNAVDRLIAAGSTALYDGVRLGLSQLAAQGGTGALVVLADGDDKASSSTLEETTDAVAASDVELSFVALETAKFNPGSLEAIAGDAGSVVKVDGAGEFAAALRDIAAGLGNLYEVRWRSASEAASAELEIALASDRGQAVSTTFEHQASGEFVPDVALDSRTVGSAGILAASWLPLVAALSVTVGVAALFLLGRNSDAARERRLERLANRDDKKASRRNALTDVQERLNDISAHVLEANGRGRSLDDTLDRAGLAIRSNEFVVFCATVFLSSLLVGVLLFGVPYFLVAGVLPVVGIPFVLRVLTNRRRKKFVSQLGDTLQLMVGSLTAGYGLGQTLDSVAREAESPTAEEFSRVVMETRLGRSLEDALDAMSHRIQAPDFDWVVDAIKIQSSVGGNLSEIIEQVGETIRARVRIKRQIDALTAEGKISALVLFVLPLGLLGFISATNPDYIKPMFSGGLGYTMLGVAVFMLSIGGLWLKKLVNPQF
jgi:tight adherence protein B